ncbi:MAG TPA: GNAT family N-acetyltransferase, partial [Acidothermaceae bacterium]
PPLVIPELSTARLSLRPLDPIRDATDLFEMDRDPRVHEYVYGSSSSQSVEETRQRLDAELAGNGGVTWTIRLHDDPTALGTLGLFGDQGTSIRGVSWSLRPSHWRQGITSEAAMAMVIYLLAQPGVEGLEAWADSRNIGSLRVATRAGMAERARLPRSYDDRIGQTVVMAVAADPTDPRVLTVTPSLQVRDVDGTASLLCDLLSLRLAWSYGQPTAAAGLAISRWSGSPEVHLHAAAGDVPVGELGVEVGGWIDDVHDAAVAAGLAILDAPADRDWGRREFTFALREGHRISVSGATTPTGLAALRNV